MSKDWAPGWARLDFLLGERRLGAAVIFAACWQRHFMDMGEDALERIAESGRIMSAKVLYVPSCPVSARQRRLRWRDTRIWYVLAQYRHFFVELVSGDFSTYLGKFSSKSRATLLRKIRKFTERSGGTIVWRRFVSSEEMPEFHALATRVSRMTYQDRLLRAGYPGTAEFLNSLSEQAARGRVCAYLLYLDRQPIAYLCCPVRDGVVYYEHVGYDPKYAEWSPGTVLQYLVLEQLFSERKHRLFDFTPGEGAHKEFFSTGSVLCADILLFRPGPRLVFTVVSHQLLWILSRGLAKLADVVGIKTQLKKWFRRQ